jgi:dCTP deaminase
MSVLSTQTLRKRIYGASGSDGDIFITPILDPKQISNSAVDIRLGRYFLSAKPARMSAIDVKDRLASEQVLAAQESLLVDYGQPVLLQPGACILGSVLEFISLPNTVYAEVVTRSSWGRLDLTIATAVGVHAGYSGCLTLELENMGAIPIKLYPGTRIGQLIFHELDKADRDQYRGKYVAPTRPEYTRIHREGAEVRRLGAIASRLRGER